MVSEYFEIAERAQLWTWDRARAFVRSRFPDLGEGRVMRGALDDFKTARNDLVLCRHCAKPLSCPLFGRPMRLVVSVEGEQKIILAQRVVCRRWKAARPSDKPEAASQQRRDLD